MLLPSEHQDTDMLRAILTCWTTVDGWYRDCLEQRLEQEEADMAYMATEHSGQDLASLQLEQENACL